MKKVLAIMAVLLAVTSCVEKQAQAPNNEPKTKLEQYADSIKKAYPNYAGNDAINKLICEDFEKRMLELPGILEDNPFHIIEGVMEVGGTYHLMLSAEGDISLSVWDENLAKETALKLDKTKLYKVTGGEVEKYEPAHSHGGNILYLGSIYVKNIQLEEIPGSHYESPIGN